jgi:integral membrane protein
MALAKLKIPKMFRNSLARFRLVAVLEGCSYLLFGITMPLKYKLGIPGPNYVIGMLHGLLFLLYIILLLEVSVKYKWNFKKILLAFIASLIPFGTFYAARKLYPVQV